MPRMSLVLSLNCVTNAPMLTPCCPSAGPTGGAGVAWPPGTCSRIWATTCFAMLFPSRPISNQPLAAQRPSLNHKRRGENPYLRVLHLPIFQLHRHRPAEDGQLHPDAALGLQQFLD